MRWRWQEDKSPGTPWANMARDEELLEELIGDTEALPIVHVYRWDRPSVSIGRLQDEHSVIMAYSDRTAVRRPTGGLAVAHGEDITISVVVRDGELPSTQVRGVLSSYRLIVEAVVQAFGHVGIPAALGRSGRSRSHSDTVDCFAHAARCDVVMESGRKLAGCAQRRKQGVILQQMSIPCSSLWDEHEFVEAFKVGLSRNLGVSVWLSVDMPTLV